VLGGEWKEFSAETTGKQVRFVVGVAMRFRRTEPFVPQFGEANDEIAIADRRWGVYPMIAKLAA